MRLACAIAIKMKEEDIDIVQELVDLIYIGFKWVRPVKLVEDGQPFMTQELHDILSDCAVGLKSSKTLEKKLNTASCRMTDTDVANVWSLRKRLDGRPRDARCPVDLASVRDSALERMKSVADGCKYQQHQGIKALIEGYMSGDLKHTAGGGDEAALLVDHRLGAGC